MSKRRLRLSKLVAAVALGYFLGYWMCVASEIIIFKVFLQ